MKRLVLFVPLVIFLGVAAFLFQGLYLNPKELDSALVGKPVPQFQLTQLEDPAVTITNKDLAGEVYLINVWATWCPSCKYEHPFLNKLKQRGEMPIYGINYRDERMPAVRYLNKSGDPYSINLFDPEGSFAFDLGVYGAPETFVVDAKGIVRYRFAGVLEPGVWARDFMPLIKQLRQEAKGIS
ncbi:DsbE family thiol:disulfide interchange protein [Ferrimonas lipolytica]|uniref:DsbE family thiol:disulfide interchange protein n=1 Tax=Ferrimonas lipolytica TaxID=2724191 RepID=A0A6H1UL16_9GAMM|nr:DsbE family thiol:disulfide interchange protein [Ferrimonas lipolytica]QIZ78492.1 DsbE family thiol:disulfide interchange protein [Ferrimonas lipolytica]